MPYYPYTCENCEHAWEILGSALDARTRPKRPTCPECKSRRTRRDIAGQIKSQGGGGFEPFWSNNCGIFPADFRRLCKDKGLDFEKTKTVELEGFTVRKGGNVLIKSKSDWRRVKQARRCREAGSYTD